MDTLLLDLRYAVRQLLARPAASGMIVLILALGIGVNTSVFTLANAALFRALPVPEPDRLVVLTTASARGAGRNLSYPEYREFRDRLRDVVDLTASEYIRLAIGGSSPERVRGILVSGNYFDALGVRAVHGRTFAPEEDDVPGVNPVIVLGHRYWQERFGGDPGLVGRSISANGQPFTVIGIAPPGFDGIEFGSSVQVWVPLAMIGAAWPAERNRLGRNETWLHVRGRLKGDATPAAATARAEQVARTLQVTPSTRAGLTGATIAPLPPGGMRPKGREQLRTAFTLLAGVGALVLLVACANVGNLLFARGMSRRREIAVRLSLGATRGRLLRQLLVESVVLSLVAGIVSLVASLWAMGSLVRFIGLPVGVMDRIAPDGRVLAFTAGLALVTGVLFGLAPALGATGLPLTAALKDDAALGDGGRRQRWRDLFVVAQVSVSLVLITTAGLFLRSLGNVLAVEPGFDARNGVALSFDLTTDGYSDAQRGEFLERLVERAAAVPSVIAVSAGGLPLSGERAGTRFVPAGAEAPEDGAMYAAVRPDYFRTMGIPLLRGRDFTARDDAGAPGVIIVNEAFARWLWPGQDPLGKLVRMGGPGQPFREIVGVVGETKYVRLSEGVHYPFAYLPERQLSNAPAMSLVVRTAFDPTPVVSQLTRIVQDLRATPPVFQVTTFEQHIASSAAPYRRQAILLAVFAALALGLAALGLYGVIAFSVGARTREIGVRMALGARAVNVLGLFVREGVIRTLLGVIIGLVLSAAATRVIAASLFGVRPIDPLAYLGGAAVLCLVAVIASYLPARRAARVDPMVALRYE